MKRGIVGLCLWLLTVFAFAQNFTTPRFDVNVKILPTGHVRVTERITVIFLIPQRGIFRTIPYRYSTNSFRDRRLVISQFSVTDENGRPLTTKISKEDNLISCRIGDADVYLPPNIARTYVVRYEVYGAINRFPANGGWEKSAELYWNAIGPEWPTRIDHSTVTVEFPAAGQEGRMRVNVFEGQYGSTSGGYMDQFGQATTVASRSDVMFNESGLTIQRNTAIQPGEAVTFVVGMPDQMIATPTLAQKIRYEWSPYFGFLVPVITMIVMPVLWLIFGRDSTRRVREEEMSPPDQVSGHVIGAVVDGRVDKQDISALLVSLAVKGKVTFDSSGGASNTKIKLVPGATNESLDAAEAQMFSLLKKAGPTVSQSDLKSEIAPAMPGVRRLIMKEAVQAGYYAAIPSDVYLAWGLLGSLGVIALGVFAYLFEPMREATVPVIGTIIGIVIAVQFARHMPKVTRKGAQTRARAKNFAAWMEQASAREDWRDYLTRNPNMFEDFLPHAIALGRDLLWIRSWNGIRRNMPGWWIAPSGVHDLSDMGDVFSSMTQKVSVAATTPPRPESSSSGSGFSSSSGGGGFSGGGFGGGGGGSW
ncbi:MAG: DUF2207 domain-containing protein [Fimbriimonadaceae bacterium]|nr:DUF2207 domain-containing protein [Fimbriimonadaceae bacterium]